MKHHIVRLEVFLRLLHGLVDVAQRRAAVAGNVAGGIEAGGAVALLLHHRQAHQRLDAVQQYLSGSCRVFVFQCDMANRHGFSSIILCACGNGARPAL
ncbi:hypothetical protein D3C72_2212270 [compost metagenome]